MLHVWYINPTFTINYQANAGKYYRSSHGLGLGLPLFFLSFRHLLLSRIQLHMIPLDPKTMKNEGFELAIYGL